MNYMAKAVIWQSFDGKWNRGDWAGEDDGEGGGLSDTDFGWLATGFDNLHQAKAVRKIGYPDEVEIVPFTPLDRDENDRLDLAGQAYGNPNHGPRIYQDRTVADAAELEHAETVISECRSRIESQRRDALLLGFDTIGSQVVLMNKQRKAEGKAEFLRPRVAEAEAKMPPGPFYTLDALRAFRDAAARRKTLASLDGGKSAQAVAFYDKLVAKAEKLDTPATASTGAVSGSQPRKPAGVPVGGQWAVRERGDTGDLE